MRFTIATLASAATVGLAQTPLFFPLPMESQAIRADVLGVDEQGRTTYVLSPGQGNTEDAAGTVSVTLVEDKTYASLHVGYSFTDVAEPGVPTALEMECTIKDGTAVCDEGTGLVV